MAESDLIAVTSETFKEEVLDASIPVLVDFWAEWCGPCKTIAPIVEEIAREFAGRVKVAKLDVDASPEIATQFSIKSIPTLLLFHDGEVVDQIIGSVPKSLIKKRLDSFLKTLS